MKLIIAGATGYVGREVVAQSLGIHQITSVIALSRKPLQLDAKLDTSKVKNVIIKDYAEYTDDIKKEFAGASACIWTVAITPTKSRMYDPAVVIRVCQDSPLAALEAMCDAGPTSPFRFIYMSGSGTIRDQSAKPHWFMGNYGHMRGAAETKLLAAAAEHKGLVELCVTKSGLILRPGNFLVGMMNTGLRTAGAVNIGLGEIAAVMLQQVLNGFEKETLENADLVRIGAEACKVAEK